MIGECYRCYREIAANKTHCDQCLEDLANQVGSAVAQITLAYPGAL